MKITFSGYDEIVGALLKEIKRLQTYGAMDGLENSDAVKKEIGFLQRQIRSFSERAKGHGGHGKT